MRTKHGRVNSYAHFILLAALCLILTGLLVAASPSGSAQAAGEWTTGAFTDDTLVDLNPALSSTHLVWAQRAAMVWNIKLRELATGMTETIAILPAAHIYAPIMSVAGDYATIWSFGGNQWLLYKISTGTLRVFPIADPTGALVRGTDGAYVVGQVHDGTDYEVVAYDIENDEWISTINTIWDMDPSLDDGRVVWEAIESDTVPPIRMSIVIYDFATASQRTLVTLDTDVSATLRPLLKGDWVGYHDLVADKFSLYRLSDGLTLQLGSSPRRWILTDDYAFWTQDRPGGWEEDTDLYAIDLHTLAVTQLTSDTLIEGGLAADGDRVVYLAAPDIGTTGDLMVVDMSVTPLAPYRLAQNVHLPELATGPAIRGDLVVAALLGGGDSEIYWARWTEEEPPEPSHAFTDVPAEHPYSTAIYDLAEREVINGYPDDTFRPNNIVLRQQFAKMIVLSLGYPVSDTDICTFTDVQTSLPGSYVDPSDPNYPDHYVAVCAAYGITEGKTPSTFAPYDGITRQQLITMVARAAGLPEPPADYTPEFTPAQFYPEEHYLNARRAAYAGLLDGLVGVGPSYDFFAASTRGECAQLLYNLLNRLD